MKRQVTEPQYLNDKQWSQIVARAWADETFKTRLESDPSTVLKEHGLEFEAGTRLILPPSPADQLFEEEFTFSPGLGSSSGTGACHRCGAY